MRSSLGKLISVLMTTALIAPPSFALTKEEEDFLEEGANPPLFSTRLPYESTRPRGYFWPPLVSFVLPGFDQWYENQNNSAMFFTGSAIGGILLASSTGDRTGPTQTSSAHSTRDDRDRTELLGSQIFMSAGSFSAYTSFRSAVRSRKPHGEFGFLTKEETAGDLMLAPFDLTLLKRPTTYVPLGLLAVLIATESGNDLFRNNSFNWKDAAFGSGFSYLAGTNEEALFRGWMMPAYMESWGSPFWSNTATALIFSLAHVSEDNPVPWPQFALGWYFGYLTQKNDWTLKEAIFVHAWWDVLAFTSVYLTESKNDKAAIYLPLLSLTF